MNKKYIRLASVLGAIAVMAGAFMISTEAAQSDTDNTTIADSVTIEGIDVGGMDADEAEEALEDYVSGVLKKTITLCAKDNEVECTAKELGISSNETEVINQALAYGSSGNILERYKAKKDIEAGKSKDFSLTFTADKDTATALLKDKKDELDEDAKDSTLTHENGEFVYVEGEAGYSVKVKTSVNDIQDYIQNEWNRKDSSIELATKEVEAKGDQEQLAKIKDQLGTFSTSYAGSDSGRRTNIENGASFINGSVVYPGDTFSTSDTLDPQTLENGYAMAASYENGETVQSVGGGVCQISTTLYNAVIRAELEVTEREPHSMMVGYVKPSQDAAIAEGVKDLKFKNNQDYPIYIEMYGDGATLTASIYGVETRPSNREVSFETEILSQTNPKTVYVADGSQPIGYVSRSGESHTGYKACLWKIVTVDGVEESREEFNTSSYRATNPTVTIGTASGNTEAVSNINAAVASQDKATIDAAIATWNDEAVAQREAEAQAQAEAEAAAQAEAEAQAAAEAAAAAGQP